MEQQNESTYNRILNAAARLFAQNGYDGTTTREIVKEAGASLSSFQTYFQSKETLYREAVDRAMVRYYDMLKPTLEEIDILEQSGQIHGETAWNMLVQLISIHAEWVFLENEKDSILLMNREMLSSQPLMDTVPESSRAVMKAIQKLCEAYVGVTDTMWGKMLGHTVVMTLFGYANYPRVLGQIMEMDVTLPENALQLKILGKGYLLVSLRAYLDSRRQGMAAENSNPPTP